MKANPPKGFTKYASSPTWEGIQSQVAAFYTGETKELREAGEHRWTVHKANGTRLDPVVIQTRRGFYFGTE